MQRRANLAWWLLVAVVFGLGSCGSQSTEVSASGAATSAPAPTVAPPAQEAPPASEDSGMPASMATLDQVAAAREAWLASGIADYSYEADAWIYEGIVGDVPESSCGSTGGRIEVTVAAGEIVAASAPDAACAIEIASPNRLPLTAEEWFDRMMEIMADFEVGEFDVNEHGFPVRLFTESRVGAIQLDVRSFALGEPGETIKPDNGRALRQLVTARERWAAVDPGDYSLTYDRVCRCAPGYRGWFSVEVVGDAVTLTVDGNEPPADLDPAASSILGLFAAIETAADADRLDVLYDDARGIPLRIDVDPSLGTADDEWTVTTIDYQPAGSQSASSVEAALQEAGADLGSAPDEALELGAAHFCGLDDVELNDDEIGGDAIVRACLAGHQARSLEAMMVQISGTVEGDPIVDVLRTNADGSITLYSDSSRDSFGSGGWSTRTCRGLQPRPEIGVNFFMLDC